MSENRGQKVLKTGSKRLHFAILFQETAVGRKYRKIACATTTDCQKGRCHAKIAICATF